MLSRQSVLTTAGLILLVGLTNYLALKNSESRNNNFSNILHITGIGQEITVTQINNLGYLDYLAYSQKIIKYSDGKTRLFNIQTTNFSKNSNPNNTPPPPWHLSALNGWSYPNNSQIDLWDNVHIFRAGSPAISKPDLKTNLKTSSKASPQKSYMPIDFQTSQLTYYPPTDLATTKQSVKISEPKTHNITTATGMIAHPKSETIQLLSQVHSTYDPPKS